MTESLKDFKESKILSKPFNKDGEPILTTSIVATLFEGRPLTREQILTKLNINHAGKSKGFLSNHFAELSKCGIIRFSKSDLALRPGENYRRYLNYVFIQLLNIDKKVANNLTYRMLPKKDAQSVDFILSPEEDVFNKPNPYLE